MGLLFGQLLPSQDDIEGLSGVRHLAAQNTVVFVPIGTCIQRASLRCGSFANHTSVGLKRSLRRWAEAPLNRSKIRLGFKIEVRLVA